MATIAQDNFDTDTAGVIAPGWTAKIGTWAVGTVGPVSGTQSFASTSNVNGDAALYTGAAPLTDMRVTVAVKLTTSPTAATNTFYPATRCDTAYQNGYVFGASTASAENSLTIFRRTSGSFTVIGTAAFSFASWVVGDIMMMEATSTGSVHELRIWKSTGSRPSAASISATDASFSSGYSGLYRGGVTQSIAAVDNFVLEDIAAAVVAPGAPTIGTAVAGAGYVDVAFTASSSGGTPTSFAATLSTGETGTGSASPIRITASAGTSRTAHVTATNSGGTSAASAESNSVTPTAVPVAATFAVTDANIQFSPYNWYSDGTGSMQANNVKAGSSFAWLNMRGGYLKFKATVAASGSIALTINTSTLSAISAAGCPQIAWSINNGAIQSKLLVAGDTTLSLATGLTEGTYSVFLYFRGVYITQDGAQTQNYTTPNNRFQVTNVMLSSGGTISPYGTRSKNKIIYGDSITEGDLSNGGPRSAASQDASLTYSWLLAQALDAEVGIVGFYGMNWDWFNTTWTNYASGLSRLVAGKLVPTPDYVVINYSENDGNPGPSASVVTATLAAVSTAAPTAKIINLIPFSGKARTNLSAATLPSNGYRIDLAPPEMLTGNLIWSYDGVHPNARGHANLAALLSNKVNALSAVAPTLNSRTVTLTLNSGVDGSGNPIPAANLTNIQVSVVDDSTRPAGSVIRYQTTTGTTNSSGVLSFTYQSTLSPGALCGVDIVMPSDKRNMAVSVAVA